MRSIVLAGSRGGSGRTSLALNLADELARGGLRVLLIDADLKGGLGLSIGRRLARLMGGELSLVDSVPGAGARFRLEVPMIGEAVAAVDDGVDRPTAAAAAPPTISRRPASSTLAPLAGVRVLLVDDARDLLLMSRRFLESAGATVTPFDQPLVALEAVAAGAQFDSAVLDLRMPELTGYELAQRLRALGYSGPLMAVSADDDSQVLARCAEAGIYRLIGKPFRREDLIAAVCAGWAEHTARATVVAK